MNDRVQIEARVHSRVRTTEYRVTPFALDTLEGRYLEDIGGDKC